VTSDEWESRCEVPGVRGEKAVVRDTGFGVRGEKQMPNDKWRIPIGECGVWNAEWRMGNYELLSHEKLY
jgi:hypothetical protein